MRKNLRTLLAFTLLLTNFSLNSFTQLPSAKAVTGCADSKGTVSESTTAGYTTVTFRGSDSLTAITNYNTSTLFATCTWSAPANLTSIEILIVGGGGGGGFFNQAGGGGAGGVLYNSGLEIAGGTDYSVKIGAGGSGSGNGKRSAITNVDLTPAGNRDPGGRTGANGGSSAFASFQALGGGGGSGGGTGLDLSPNSGGSGGGGAGYKNNSLIYSQAQLGASSTQLDPDGATSGWVSFGNSGANGYNNANSASSIRSGGGGGGAGSAGSTPTNGAGGIGGAGVTLMGFNVGGGGAGIAFSPTGVGAGTADAVWGGGCSTGLSGCTNGSGTNGTGGGGGATLNDAIGSGENKGGSGIVVIKYGAATPTVVTNPSNVSNAIENGSASFTVTGSITDTSTGGVLTYQWQRSTNSGSTWSDISGEIATTLSLSGLTTAMSGYQYRALLTNTRNGVTSSTSSSAATLTVRSIDATLSNLQYTPAEGSLTSVSGFTGSGTSYTFNVLTSQATVTIRPTATVAQSTITVNGTSVTSGTNSAAISLSTGYNTVTVVVTSQSGTVSQSISLTILRQTNLCSPATDSSTAYTVLRFTSVGVCQWSVPAGITTADVLVVAGGGAGGTANNGAGGGGGGGQVTDQSNKSVSGVVIIQVGSGGTPGGISSTRGNDGEQSAFVLSASDSITARGGSAGGSVAAGNVGTPSSNGFNGGGGSTWADSATAGSTGVGGNSGGDANPDGNYADKQAAGGGGGSGGAGSPATESNGGAGGGGTPNSFSGASVTYGGGGGGAKRTSTDGVGGAGGSGGGGNGGKNSAGSSGGANTGGGGGGSGSAAGESLGGTGGSGIVIIRYLNAPTITGTRIFGTLKVGQTLSIIDTATTGTISSTTYQWSSSDTSSGSYTNISGAINSTYTLTNSEYGKFLKVLVTVTNSSGSSNHTSNATGSAVVYANPTIGGVSITGTSQVGETLTATTSSVTGSGTSTTYQWSSSSTSGGTYTNISGANSSTYQIAAIDVATYIKVTATVTNDGGSATATSTATLINSGSALTPTFGTPTATADGFTVSITNFDAAFTWATPTVSSGSVAITSTTGSTQLLTVSGLSPGASATITQNTTRTGYTAGTATATGSATAGSALTPNINDVTATNFGFTVSQKNYSSSFTYTFTLTNGALATMDTATGLITVTNLSPGTSSTITITTTRANYETGTATVNGSPIPNKTVTFDANGGTGSMSSQVARTSTALTLNDFTRQFYVFNSWNDNSYGTGNTYTNGQAFSFASDLTLYAVWTPISLTVTFNSQGGTSVDTSTTTYSGKISTAPTQPTRDGYTFLGWFTESSGGTAITFEYVHNQSANFTLYAQWSANTLNITYDANGGTTPAGGSATTRTGSTISTLATTSRDGYTFNGWFTTSSAGTQITTSAAHNQTANFTLYAQWSADALTNVITFNPVSTQIYGTSLDLASYVSATSGLTVTLASSTTAICTISTATVTAIAAGTCTITASQAGNGSYPAASNVSRSFRISKKDLTITVAGLNANFGDSISNPTYTQSGLVTSLGDAISTPTFYYTGTSATYYPRSTSKPTQVGIYTISIISISLSAGKIGNYEVSFVSSELVISSVASNTISSLTIRASSGDVSSNLLSNFDNATTNYQIYVSEAVSGVVVNLTRAGPSLVSMRVKINESGWRRINFSSNSVSSGVVPLPAATNTLLVSTVSSDKGVKQFTITIYRDTKTAPRTGNTASPVPTVSPTPAGSALSTVRFLVNNSGDISSGLQTVSLSPTFNQSVTSYTATFTNTQSAAVMKADFTAAGVTLRLKINNGPFTSIPSTGASSTISLNVGSNTAILRATSTDGTSRDYTFTLTRSAAAAGLTPSFGSPTATSDGFTVQISNYSRSYSWGVTTTVGSATINDSGLITVTALSASATTIAVTSRRSGYANARSTLTYP